MRNTKTLFTSEWVASFCSVYSFVYFYLINGRRFWLCLVSKKIEQEERKKGGNSVLCFLYSLIGKKISKGTWSVVGLFRIYSFNWLWKCARECRLERESGVFFNMKYFEECVTNGDWDEVENYLSGFSKFDENRHSMKIFFEIRKQRYLEALDR